MFFNLFCGSEKAEATLGILFVVKAGNLTLWVFLSLASDLSPAGWRT